MRPGTRRRPPRRAPASPDAGAPQPSNKPPSDKHGPARSAGPPWRLGQTAEPPWTLDTAPQAGPAPRLADTPVANDKPHVELSDTEIAEALSGRIIPIGAFFASTQAAPPAPPRPAAPAGKTDPPTAGASGAGGAARSPDRAEPTLLSDASRLATSWARERHLSITSACGIGIALAVCAAAWFSAGTRVDIIRGVVALWAGYLVLRAGQWLARLTDQPEGSPADADEANDQRARSRRRITGPVGWLAALGGAVAECGVYAGLAAGAIAERWGEVWTLAIAVLSLVAVRNLMTVCSTPPGFSAQPAAPFRRLAAAVVTMPLGGRVLLIGIVAPVWGARTALLALLDWAVISIGYGIAGRAIAGMTGHGGQDSQLQAAPSKLTTLRDDGALARTIGALVRGTIMPLPPALLGLAAVSALAYVGLHGLPGVLLIAPALVMLLAAPGAAHPHTGRFDWLVPVLLLGAQCLYLAATGLAVRVPSAVIFALIAAIVLRYIDLEFPGRPVQLSRRRDPDATPAEVGTGLGWEGRMLIAGLAAAMGVATIAYALLTAYLVGLICSKAVTSRLVPRAEARHRPAAR